jgi:hypothetical protein
MRIAILGTVTLLLAACGGEAPQQQAEVAPEKLAAGQYEANWTVAQLRSTDQSNPATNLKANATGTTTACVGDDGAIDPALFAEDGDTCTTSNAYVRNGRISFDVTCKRGRDAGEIRQSVNGNYTADGLEAEVSTTTYLAGSGDYTMVRNFTGKRIGECPPPTEPTGNAS